MDDPAAVAQTIRQHYERWIAVADRRKSNESDARQARLEHLESEITNQLKFTRADTQGNVNAKPIKLLILEQAQLEKEIEDDQQAYAEELQTANQQLLNALHGISPLPTPPASALSTTLGCLQTEISTAEAPPLNPSTRDSNHLAGQAPRGSLILGNDDYPSPSRGHDTSRTHRPTPANGQTRLARAHQPNHSPLQKRPSNATLPANHSSKRPRLEEAPPSLTPGRAIEFHTLFQNGSAATKYKVVRFPPDNGHWYILECKKCDKSFRSVDIMDEAMLHLQSSDHTGSSTTPRSVIERLGTRVSNCTEELAQSNNAAFDRAHARGPIVHLGTPSPGSGSIQTSSGGRTKKRKKAYQWNPPKSYSELKPEVMNPKPEDIFACWQKPKCFYPVMILPWGRFERFDFEATLQHTGLNENIPDCYFLAQKTDMTPRAWAGGYENHGLHAHKRMYPVLFFNRVNFPIGCSVGWVALHSLKAFDKNCPHTLRKELVQEYLELTDQCEEDTADEANNKPTKLPRLTNPQASSAARNIQGTVGGSFRRKRLASKAARLALLPYSLESSPDEEERTSRVQGWIETSGPGGPNDGIGSR